MKKKTSPINSDLIRLIDRKKQNNNEEEKIQRKKNANQNPLNEEVTHKYKTISNKPIINLSNNDYKIKNINKNYIITILRIRPESEEEQNYSNIKILKVESSTSVKIVSPTEYNYFVEGSKFLNNDRGLEVTKTKEYNFKFDYIFDRKNNQNEVFQISTAFLVDNIFDGYNSMIFAYGASGSGKTYTMFGTWEKPGIIIRAINSMLNIMEANQLSKDYDLQISYYEIYNESVYDLLADDDKSKSKKRKIAESSTPYNRDSDYIKYSKKNNINSQNKFCLMGITKKIIRSEDEAFIILSEANKIRSKGITSLNVNSSRSHGIVQINIVHRIVKKNNNLNKNSIENREKTIFGKFILVDLAGTEKIAEVRPNTDNFYINKSIFTLNNCINGLVNDKNTSYIPWRDSKLTRVLKEPLSGNSKIVMIANISPSLMVIEDTYNTLNFAKKIKMVRTYAQKNFGNQFVRIDKFDCIIQSLKDQISMIRNEIRQKEDGENSFAMSDDQNDYREIGSDDKNMNEVLQEFIGKINAHFQKEIDVIRQISDLELKISNINNENYFSQPNDSQIKQNNCKLNDIQTQINSLYAKRHELIGKRKVIQMLITNEMKKSLKSPDYGSIGTYLMYVYKYNINLINELQDKNRKYKIDNDIIRKDNQIQNLNSQIKIRDNVLKYIKEKTGSRFSFNIKKFVDLDELNKDPCVDMNTINHKNNLEHFVQNVVGLTNRNKIKRNISIPALRTKIKILKNSNIHNRNMDNSLPLINTKSNSSEQTINYNSSLVKKRIPSGYILKKHGTRYSNLKSDLYSYKKYYNLYHVSNNYHVGNLRLGNPIYVKQKRNSSSLRNRNNSCIDFEKDYSDKVKTILNKNYISRYYNSPYSFEKL